MQAPASWPPQVGPHRSAQFSILVIQICRPLLPGLPVPGTQPYPHFGAKIPLFSVHWRPRAPAGLTILPAVPHRHYSGIGDGLRRLRCLLATRTRSRAGSQILARLSSEQPPPPPRDLDNAECVPNDALEEEINSWELPGVAFSLLLVSFPLELELQKR